MLIVTELGDQVSIPDRGVRLFPTTHTSAPDPICLPLSVAVCSWIKHQEHYFEYLPLSSAEVTL